MTTRSQPVSLESRDEELENQTSTESGQRFSNIYADGNTRQHNGNIYNSNTNHYTLKQRRSDETLRESGLDKRCLKAAAEGQSRRVEYLHRLGADLDYIDEFQLTPLHHACFNGFEDTVETLLQMGSDANAHSELYGSPLCVAAIKGRRNVVDVLLNARANVHDSGGLLGSTMHAACIGGDVSILEKLVGLGCSVNVERVFCRTLMDAAASGQLITDLSGKAFAEGQPLHGAVRQVRPDVLEFLLRKGADVNARSSSWIFVHGDSVAEKPKSREIWDGLTALMYAAGLNHCKATLVRLLGAGADLDSLNGMGRTAAAEAAAHESTNRLSALIRRGADLEIEDHSRHTPLILAAANGRDKALTLLVDAGVALDSRSLLQPQTALSKAATFNHTNCVKILLEAGADPTVRDEDEDGYTAAHWAAQQGNIESLELLLRAGISLDASTKNLSETVMTLAAKEGHLRCVELLIQMGHKDPRWPDTLGMSLHHAAENGHTAIVESLLKADARPNTRDEKKRTPLHSAASGGHANIIRSLLAVGADLDPTDVFGQTPLMRAARADAVQVVEELVSAGSNVCLMDTTGKTAQSLAEWQGSAEVVTILENARSRKRSGRKSNRYPAKPELYDRYRSGERFEKTLRKPISPHRPSFGQR